MVIHTESKYICICDGGNNRVQVFNKSFEFVSEFSEEMVWPVGICIGMNEIYVTQIESDCLNVYSMGGIFLKICWQIREESVRVCWAYRTRCFL